MDQLATVPLGKGTRGAMGPCLQGVAARLLPDLMRSPGVSAGGLTGDGAAVALRTAGPSRIDAAASRRRLAAFVRRFRNLLVLILLAAVSAFMGDAQTFAIITFIVLASVILDVVQKHRAEGAAEGLCDQMTLSTMVLPNGKAGDVSAVEIVPGDMVLLAAGSLVPTDRRLIQARDLYVNEAMLTGKPYPAVKDAALIPNMPPRDAPAPTSNATLPGNLVFLAINRTRCCWPARCRPSRWLWLCPLRQCLLGQGFAPLPAAVLGALALLTASSLLAVFGVKKRWCFSRCMAGGTAGLAVTSGCR